MSGNKRWFWGLATVFLVAYFLPIASPKIQGAILEAFRTTQWYARYHTLACVVPAMFIAGAISTFLSKEAILKHLGPKAKKAEAYGVASVSGTVLSVCSCSVLPMFAGIYRIGAGLGPACAFLCSGPAINIMAIFLTARVLGFDLGLARTLAAIGLSVGVGVLMAAIFRKSESERIQSTPQFSASSGAVPTKRKGWQTGLFLTSLILFLVFSDWVRPGTTALTFEKGAVLTRLDAVSGNEKIVLSAPIRLETSITLRTSGDLNFQLQNVLEGSENLTSENLAHLEPDSKFFVETRDVASVEQIVPENYRWSEIIYRWRWGISAFFGLVVFASVFRWFDRDERREWLEQTWSFGKTIVPLLLGGVFVTGFISAILPAESVASWVGGNSLRANLVASVVGSLWYFATLTEIPMLQALMDLGMGKGPALTLLLAGPTLSLPSVVVIGKYLGFKKTAAFVGLVVALSSAIGWAFGAFAS